MKKDDPLASLVPELHAPSMAKQRAGQPARGGDVSGVSGASTPPAPPPRTLAAPVPARPPPGAATHQTLGFSPRTHGEDAFAALTGGGVGKGRCVEGSGAR